jgi:hypothetical protein
LTDDAICPALVEVLRPGHRGSALDAFRAASGIGFNRFLRVKVRHRRTTLGPSAEAVHVAGARRCEIRGLGEATISEVKMIAAASSRIASQAIKRALELSATAILLVHNHRSSDPATSQADMQMTKAIIGGAAPLGISVHGHIIVGKNGRASKGLSAGLGSRARNEKAS